MNQLNTFLVIWLDHYDTGEPRAALITTTLGAEAAPAALLSCACDMTFNEASEDIADGAVTIVGVFTGDITLRAGALFGTDIPHFGKHLLHNGHQLDIERQASLHSRKVEKAHV